jgi:hypothetical protein
MSNVTSTHVNTSPDDDEDDISSLQVVPAAPRLAPAQSSLDDDEAELAALRIDLPGAAGAPSGTVSIRVNPKFPKNMFFRCRPDPIAFYMVTNEAGMDTEFNIVAPNMVPELTAINIDARPYTLYLIKSAEGATQIMPVLSDNDNAWNQTKVVALVRAQKEWIRASSDLANGRYLVFGATPGRFPEPSFPDLGWGKLVRLAFTDHGRKIDSKQHPLYRKWASIDAD